MIFIDVSVERTGLEELPTQPNLGQEFRISEGKELTLNLRFAMPGQSENLIQNAQFLQVMRHPLHRPQTKYQFLWWRPQLSLLDQLAEMTNSSALMENVFQSLINVIQTPTARTSVMKLTVSQLKCAIQGSLAPKRCIEFYFCQKKFPIMQ